MRLWTNSKNFRIWEKHDGTYHQYYDSSHLELKFENDASKSSSAKISVRDFYMQDSVAMAIMSNGGVFYRGAATG